MRMMDVDKLKPHPKNNYFFDDIEGEPWTAFLESIETSGVIEPVIVDAADLTIISGHQRVRACKVLSIKQVAVEERGFDSEDERLKQLIETNMRQRGIGNINFVKFGRCELELRRIYGIQKGNNQYTKEDGSNGAKQKTQKELADEAGVSVSTYKRSMQVAELNEPIQQMVMEGKVPQSTASREISKLSAEEQDNLYEQIGDKDKVTDKEVKELIAEIRAKDLKIAELEQSNSSLHNANKILAKQANQKEVVKEPVEIEVIPDDYEDLKKKVSEYEDKELVKRFEGFIAQAHVFTFKYKDGWSFEKWNNLPSDTREGFIKAVNDISELSKMLEKQIGEL